MTADLATIATDELVTQLREVVDGVPRDRCHVDAYFERVAFTSVRKTRASESLSRVPSAVGLSFRVHVGRWHELGTQDLEDVPKLREKLYSLADRDPEPLDVLPAWSVDARVDCERPVDRVPVEEKLEKVRAFAKGMAGADDRVVNPVVVYADSVTEKVVVNNEGSVLRQIIPQVRLFLQPVAREGDRQDFDYFSLSGQGGWELVERVDDDLLEEVVRRSVTMLDAKAAPSGKMTVVLDPDVAGLVAHESFGHGLEADQVLRGRSYLEPLLGKLVASPVCNISDSPVVPSARGSYFFDDEGVKPEKTPLVEGGVLKNFIHERASATAFGVKPRGNGRRESFAHRVNARMSNTFFEAGDYSEEEVFEGVSRGVFLERGYFGMEDPLGGGIQCTSKKGWLVEGGRKTTLLGPVTLSGRVLDLLKSIDAVGKDVAPLHGGTCGKGTEDYVPVTSGGPFLRAREAVVGPG
ncbi:MAG: TldD/PmbA family protein [Promethearchaeota archaeon]